MRETQIRVSNDRDVNGMKIEGRQKALKLIFVYLLYSINYSNVVFEEYGTW